MLKAKLILIAIKSAMWITAVGIGIWYLSSSINGGSITYSSMNGFLQAAGACDAGAGGAAEACDISQSNGCFLCPYVRQLFEVIGVSTQDFWDALVSNLWVLLALGFVIFLIVHTFKTLSKANKENISMTDGARNMNFGEWFKGVKDQGIRVLLVGAFLGALSFGGTGVLKTVADITIRPVMFVGSELAMAATGTVLAAHCPAMDSQDESNIIGPALKPFMCVVGNASTVILAGASGGFSLMNFSYMDMGGGLFTWLAGLGMVIMFLIIGFSLFFDILNIVFRLVFIIIFLPVIIAGYAYKETWKVLGGAVGKSVEMLINCATSVIAVTLKVMVIYAVVTYGADEYFPGPMDGYSAIFPPGLAGMKTADESENIVVAQVFVKCEKASLVDDAMDNDLFAECFNREKAAAEMAHPGAFDFMQDGWRFFTLMLGMFLLYFYVVRKKIDEILVKDSSDGKAGALNIGTTFKEFGKKAWNLPVGITKKITGAIWKK